jgi:phospholipase/carboxylesterase
VTRIHVKQTTQVAKACIIWMHGLGSSAEDMMGLATQLPLVVPVRHVFLDAPMRPVTMNNGMLMPAWYDITGLSLADREDEIGITGSARFIEQVIQTQVEAGFDSTQIFLAGFSQGGAMALYTGVHASMPLAGLISLSAYLPLQTRCQVRCPLSTPCFIAAGTKDVVVLPAWTQYGYSWLLERQFTDVSWFDYLMEHTVCHQELLDLSQWLTPRIRLMGDVS